LRVGLQRRARCGGAVFPDPHGQSLRRAISNGSSPTCCASLFAPTCCGCCAEPP
jgi:hypothetical protein